MVQQTRAPLPERRTGRRSHRCRSRRRRRPAPARAGHTGLDRFVRERSVAIVLIEAAHRRLADWPPGFEARAVEQENVASAVVTVGETQE